LDLKVVELVRRHANVGRVSEAEMRVMKVHTRLVTEMLSAGSLVLNEYIL
jgi:hypothetical protein